VFKDVKKSFPEINSGLFPSSKNSFMLSSPISGKIYYNKKILEQKKFSATALKGALAHELSHQIHYKNKSLIYRLLFGLRYRKNRKFKEFAEKEADRIAIERGFGKELIALWNEYKLQLGKERFETRIKPFHLSEKEIKKLMK